MKNLTSPTLLRLLGAALLATASAACSGTAGSAPATPASASAPAATPVAAPVAAGSGLMAQIQAEIGAAACDSDAQCKTIAIGHKACGGPESYLAYSTKSGDGAKLAKLAEQHAAERKAQDTKTGRMSTCSVVMDPGASCSAGRCVTAGAGLGGASAR